MEKVKKLKKGFEHFGKVTQTEKEFDLKERRNLLKKNANLLTKEEILIEVDRQDKEFIRLLKGKFAYMCRKGDWLEGWASFETIIDKLAGEKFR